MIYETLDDIGGRPYMEDVLEVAEDDGGWSSLCVADGHGGAAVARRSMELLPRACVRELRGCANTDDHILVSKLMWRAFNDVDRALLAESSPHVGATFCGLFYDRRAARLIATNCGDTMAALFYLDATDGALRSELISTEHKASSEAAALRSRGANVVDVYGMMRVQGTLNLSRALGDGYLKKYIICSPAVTVVRLDRVRRARDRPVCVVVASDGVWDVLNKDELGGILRAAKVFEDATQLRAAAEAIHRSSRARGSTDNVAIIVAILD